MKRHYTLYAYYRFGRHILHEFRWPLAVFLGLVLGVGALFSWTYADKGRALPFGEACYAVFLMIFVQNYLEFPREWYLAPFFFLVPILGLGAVADSVVRLGYLVFTRKQNLPEWHTMIASTLRNHIVLCGVGRVGYRILEELLALKENVVGIERNGDSPLVAEMLDRGVPILIGEARLKKTLEAANLQAARAVILATDDDLANIDAALTAREIKPDIRVVLRIFDDTMANKVATAFNMPAISTSATSASAMIASATDRHIFQSFQFGGQKHHVAGLTVNVGSRLCDRSVGDVQKEFGVNIVMYMSGGKTAVNPEHGVQFGAGDEIVFIASIDSVARLEGLNR